MPSGLPEVPRPTVLVVDDEPGMREGIRRVLLDAGYGAEVAANGEEALALVAWREFPLLLVDLRMPGVDGFELIERVRAQRPTSLCVVVSAFATIESAVQSTKMGAFDFVVKPFTPEELLRVVDRAAEQWRLAREAERLKAEREAHLFELAAEKSRLRSILQAMGEGLLVVNIDGEVVLDNPVARHFLGRVSTPLMRLPLEAVVADRAFVAQVKKLLADRASEAVVKVELTVPVSGSFSWAGLAAADPASAEGATGGKQGNEERILAASMAPVHDESGQQLGVVIVLRDVTEAKAFERTKNLFISMVAHEVKAPIGAVEGYLRLIQENALGGDPKNQHEVIGRCLERTGALLALVQDLLEITRRESGRVEKRVEAVNLADLLQELVRFHAADAARRSIRFDLRPEGDLPPVLVDRYDLERLITNLLSNAIKYNREGGQVFIRSAKVGQAVLIEVEDTGIGMSAEERARLGEEFFRAKNPQTRSITGTGLGIALVKRIVESYHGDLSCESQPGKGTTFRLLLPSAPGSTSIPGDQGSMRVAVETR
jgi:two-component system, OmpR family, phosphate regulon sensor histidine kinase PhoR